MYSSEEKASRHDRINSSYEIHGAIFYVYILIGRRYVPIHMCKCWFLMSPTDFLRIHSRLEKPITLSLSRNVPRYRSELKLSLPPRVPRLASTKLTRRFCAARCAASRRRGTSCGGVGERRVTLSRLRAGRVCGRVARCRIVSLGEFFLLCTPGV